MCGCTGNGYNNSGCTIILLIIILAFQGLLDGSPRSKNAITLLLIWWLCNSGKSGCGNNCQSLAYNNNACSNSCGCFNKGYCYNTGCCSTCYCAPKSKKCRCKRVKLCYANGAPGNGCGCC